MKRSIGIYINKNTLQLVVLNKGLAKVRLAASDSIKMPIQTTTLTQPVFSAVPGEFRSTGGQEYITGEKIKKQQESESLKALMAYQDALSGLLKRHNIKQGEVVAVALPPELIAVRYFQMPRLTHQEHKTAIPFEARKYIPYKLEDTIHTYTISYEKVASIKMAVTFVAAEKSQVFNYIKFIESTGLKVGYLEPLAYSLMRFFYYTRDVEAGQTAALIHIGRDSANINLVRNRILYLTRNVSFFAKIGPMSQVQLSSAASDFGQDVSSNIRFDSLLAETRLSFDYFHRQFPEEKIEKVTIWSDDKKAHDWGKNMGKELNATVRVSNPFEVIEGAQSCSVDYATACGLALRPLYESEKDVNLSPALKNIETERLVRVAIFEIIVAVAALFMLFTLDISGSKDLETRLNKMLVQNSNNQSKIANAKGVSIQSVKQKSQAKFDYLQNLIEKKFYISLKISKMAELLPNGLWINSIDFNKPKGRQKQVFTIKGFAYKVRSEEQLKTINQFLDSLKKDPEFTSDFKDIRLDHVLNDKPVADIPVTSFQISCSLE